MILTTFTPGSEFESCHMLCYLQKCIELLSMYDPIVVTADLDKPLKCYMDAKSGYGDVTSECEDGSVFQ